ncbi:MAG: NINE protein [Verrucomicrobiota bacterium]|jgi:TM2 domain-containing membrane protein YozV
MYKIIGIDGRQYGPVSAEDVRRWLAENRAQPQTLAQAEGAPDWKPLSAFAEFAADFKPAPPPVIPPPGPAAPRASQKIPAGIFGILLGALGIHKFILGYTGAGLIMLLLTVLSCFILWPLMHLIGLIEGIIYLCKPDEEFVRVYVDGRREWF